MEKPNVIIITIDEGRRDDLGIYGQKEINTQNLDSWAREGVVFEKTYTTAPYTPVSIASLYSGVYPNKHGRRNPFNFFTPPMTIAEIMKINGYKTAAWVSGNLTPSTFGYDAGFDEYNEPIDYLGFRSLYPEYDDLNDKEFNKKIEKMLGEHEEELFSEGAKNLFYWWIKDLTSWIMENKKDRFFIHAHCFETHAGQHKFLIEKGLIKKGIQSKNLYHKAKIEMADKLIINPITSTLKTLGLYEKTITIFQSDHGTMLSDRPGVKPLPPSLAAMGNSYPEHHSLHDCDTVIPNIWRGPGLPKDVKVKGIVRQIDTVPTILELCGIEPPKIAELDGVSLMQFIKTGRAEGLIAYIEHLDDDILNGCQQALCIGRYKFIRSLSKGIEELYDLEYDPNEYVNLLHSIINPMGIYRKNSLLKDHICADSLWEWRKELNKKLLDIPTPTRTIRKPKKVLDEAGKKEVDDRLRSIGYIH